MIITGIVFAAVRLLMAFHLITLEGHWLAGFTALAHVYIWWVARAWWVDRVKYNLKAIQHGTRFPDLLAALYYCTEQPWQWRWFWFMNAVEVFSAIVSRSIS